MKCRGKRFCRLLAILLSASFFAAAGFAQTTDRTPLDEKRLRDQRKALEDWRQRNWNPETERGKNACEAFVRNSKMSSGSPRISAEKC